MSYSGLYLYCTGSWDLNNRQATFDETRAIIELDCVLSPTCWTAHNKSLSQYASEMEYIYMQIGQAMILSRQQVLGNKYILMKYLLFARCSFT